MAAKLKYMYGVYFPYMIGDGKVQCCSFEFVCIVVPVVVAQFVFSVAHNTPIIAKTSLHKLHASEFW